MRRGRGAVLSGYLAGAVIVRAQGQLAQVMQGGTQDDGP